MTRDGAPPDRSLKDRAQDGFAVGGIVGRGPAARGLGLKWEREVRRRHYEFSPPGGIDCACLVLYSADNEHWRLVWLDDRVLKPRRLERRMARAERRLARWLRRHELRDRTADDLVEGRNEWLS